MQSERDEAMIRREEDFRRRPDGRIKILKALLRVSDPKTTYFVNYVVFGRNLSVKRKALLTVA